MAKKHTKKSNKQSNKNSDNKFSDKNIKSAKEKITADLWTIPNILTMSRIILTPIIFYLLYKDKYVLGVTLLLFGALTDFLDGYIARKYNMKSKIGLILDPLADKIAIFALVMLLMVEFSFPLWLVVIILFRDVLLVIGGIILILIDKNNISSLSSNMYGKLSTVSQFTAMFAFLMTKIFDVSGKYLLGVSLLLYIACAITIFSGMMYILKGYRIFRKKIN